MAGESRSTYNPANPYAGHTVTFETDPYWRMRRLERFAQLAAQAGQAHRQRRMNRALSTALENVERVRLGELPMDSAELKESIAKIKKYDPKVYREIVGALGGIAEDQQIGRVWREHFAGHDTELTVEEMMSDMPEVGAAMMGALPEATAGGMETDYQAELAAMMSGAAPGAGPAEHRATIGAPSPELEVMKMMSGPPAQAQAPMSFEEGWEHILNDPEVDIDTKIKVWQWLERQKLSQRIPTPYQERQQELSADRLKAQYLRIWQDMQKQSALLKHRKQMYEFKRQTIDQSAKRLGLRADEFELGFEKWVAESRVKNAIWEEFERTGDLDVLRRGGARRREGPARIPKEQQQELWGLVGAIAEKRKLPEGEARNQLYIEMLSGVEQRVREEMAADPSLKRKDAYALVLQWLANAYGTPLPTLGGEDEGGKYFYLTPGGGTPPG